MVRFCRSRYFSKLDRELLCLVNDRPVMRGEQFQAAPMMKRALAAAAIATALCALWSALVVTWALKGMWTPIATRDDASAFMAAAIERVNGAGIGNCAIALRSARSWRRRWG